MAQMTKNPPAMQETQFWSLIQEDSLEKGIFSIPALRILWTEEPGRLQSIGLQSQTKWETNTLTQKCQDQYLPPVIC